MTIQKSRKYWTASSQRYFAFVDQVWGFGPFKWRNTMATSWFDLVDPFGLHCNRVVEFTIYGDKNYMPLLQAQLERFMRSKNVITIDTAFCWPEQRLAQLGFRRFTSCTGRSQMRKNIAT